MISEQHHDRLISIDQLRETLGGLSRATIYRHLAKIEEFPKALKVGGGTRFRQSDLDRYIASLGEGSQSDNEAA